MAKLELNEAEGALVSLLLAKELEETRVEVHHARNPEYKSELLAREALVRGLVERLKAARTA